MSLPAAGGLYAITSSAICFVPERLEAAVAAALRGGARVIQYRDKDSDAAGRRLRAMLLRSLCHRAAVPLIINDDPLLAKAVDADGVHLGRSDPALEHAREVLGRGRLLGVSCSSDLEYAQQSVQRGADYVAFGRFFGSRTKPDAPPAALELLGRARALLAVPVCAIGGITPQTAAQVRAAGAHWIAAVDAVFGSADPEAAARAFATALAKDPA